MSNIHMHGVTAFAGKRILVVEDEFLIAMDIQGIVEGTGAKAVVANRVKEGLELANKGPFDAALLDLKLSHETSIPIAERLHADGVPFVFLTGAPEDAAIAARFKEAPVVAKPFDREILLSALNKALATRR